MDLLAFGVASTVYHVLSDRQVEPFGGLNPGMSGQFFDLVKTESLDDPIAQAGPPEIMEGARFDASQPLDLVEVMAELLQRRTSVFDRPLTCLAEFLDTLILSDWNESGWSCCARSLLTCLPKKICSLVKEVYQVN
jgi:hypothetical protein